MTTTDTRIAPFHPQCVADVAAGLGKTCEECVARAARNRSEGETVRGYLLCVAAAVRH